MADAFVLAAGLGTRLRPLTDHRPKPLAPVCGVPMLAYSLALCGKHGFRDVIVNAHWLADQVERWAGEHEGVHVTVSTEPVLLGTGGGLRAVRDRLAERFVVVNADVLCDVDLRELVEFVPDGGACMSLRHHAVDAARYGVVAANADGVIVRLTAVASLPGERAFTNDTHFTGVHAMHRSTLDLVPDGLQCIVRTAYKALVPQRKVRGLDHDGLWLDIGDPEAYLAANLAALAGDLDLPLDPFTRQGDRGILAGAKVEGAVWVGKDVQLGRDVTLRNVVLGDGARVADGADLVDCVVWDGASIAGSHRRTIAHDGGHLAVG